MVDAQQSQNSLKSDNFRKISKDKYIIAAIITVLVFCLGITLGFVIDDHRYNLVEEVNMEQEVKYLSLQSQYLYMNTFGNYDNCPILSTALKDTVKDLSDSLSKVIAYEEENNADVSNMRREVIMRRYLLDNIRYWILAEESKRKCDLNAVPILYFYSGECPSCPNQGTILTYFKNQFEEQVLVFPINLDYRNIEPMVEVIRQQFNITKYPTIVVEGKKYEGVVQQEQLQKIICSSLTSAPQCAGEKA